MNGLETGLGVLCLVLAGVVGWSVLRGRRHPPGERHLPPGLAANPRSRQGQSIFPPVTVVALLSVGLLLLLRGLGGMH